jgi:hypothetical protein
MQQNLSMDLRGFCVYCVVVALISGSSAVTLITESNFCKFALRTGQGVIIGKRVTSLFLFATTTAGSIHTTSKIRHFSTLEKKAQR